MTGERDRITGTRWRWDAGRCHHEGDWVQDPNGTHVARLEQGRIVLVEAREVAA